MNTIKRILARHRGLKRFADKKVFTWNIRIVDAPAPESSIDIINMYAGKGLMHYLRLILGKKVNETIKIVARKDRRRTEDEYRIYLETDLIESNNSVEVIKVVPGQRFFITLTLKDDVIHARINNRTATLSADCSTIDSGYSTTIPSLEGWAVKFDTNY